MMKHEALTNTLDTIDDRRYSTIIVGNAPKRVSRSLHNALRATVLNREVSSYIQVQLIVSAPKEILLILEVKVGWPKYGAAFRR